MCLTTCLFLLIFNTGYLFGLEHLGCGGNIDIPAEKSGFIRYLIPTGEDDTNNITSKGRENSDSECIWVIAALPDQKVQLEVISIDNLSRVWATFENNGDERVYALEESSRISVRGKVIVTWRAKRYADAQQSIHLFFTTDWKDIGNFLEGGKGKATHKESVMHTETSSPSISGAPEVSRRFRPLGSPEPALDGKGRTPRATEKGGQRSDYGTVDTFLSLTSDPTHRLSPSVSASSDKEVPPLPQETTDNNPDTSAAARTEASARGLDGAAEIWKEETKSEPPRFLDTPTNPSGPASTTFPPTQGLESIFPGLGNRTASSPEAAPLSHTDSTTALSQLSALFPTLHPHWTSPVPPSRTPSLRAERGRDFYDHTDSTSGSPQGSVASLSPSSVLQFLEKVAPHKMASTVAYSPSGISVLDSSDSLIAHGTATLAGGPERKVTMHTSYKPGFSSPVPGGWEISERQSTFDSVSTSILGLSQGRRALPEGTASKSSWTVSDLEHPVSYLPVDTTGSQQALKVNGSSEMIPGSTEAEDTLRLSSLVTRSFSEEEKSDIPLRGVLEDTSLLLASTKGPTGIAAHSLNSSSMEDVVGSAQSAGSGRFHGEAPSFSTPLELNREKHASTLAPCPFGSCAATLVPELHDEARTDFTVSAPRSETPTHSAGSVDQSTSGMPTEKPGIKSSLSTPNSYVNFTSIAAVSKDSLGVVFETSPTHESHGVNTSSYPLVFTEANGTGLTPTISTAPAALTTAETWEVSTVTEGISSTPPTQSTPDLPLPRVTIGTNHLATDETQSGPVRRGTEKPKQTVPHSGKMHSGSRPSSAYESIFHSSTITARPVVSDITYVGTEARSPSVTPPLAAGSVAGNLACSLPACSSVSPHTAEELSPSVRDVTQGTRRAGCDGCTVALSTAGTAPGSRGRFNPAATVVATAGSTGPSRRTHETTASPLPFTSRPGPTFPTLSHKTVSLPTPPSTQADLSKATQPTSSSSALTSSARPIRGRVFIVENQPAILKEERVQLLLQMVLESGSPGEDESPQPEGIKEDAVRKVEPLLQKAPGYEGLLGSWASGNSVVQGVPVFNTAGALSWLVDPGGLLDVTGLRDTVRQGLFLGGAKVANISVGGLQPDLCSWLFICPTGFQCVPTGVANASCTSLCHMDYCKNSGICTHHHGQQPVCQCPVGEDFWYMGRSCDIRMTRLRLVGVCLGVLLSAALLMAVLSYLIIRRFKAMLIQAKVDQTRSSYRKFNHFDELSSRFWLRSWPGSADSLDNPAYSRSDELLHLRALDRTCCYHDDTLSIASTYPSSGTHLNTIYAPGSHYNWDLGEGSINDWLADSGKASDLSVCSWPIEPIQWTPFPLLQQLGIQRSAKTPRPHSYCEGMELVDLEKTWTA